MPNTSPGYQESDIPSLRTRVRCPSCRGALLVKEATANCAGCGRAFPVCGGVVAFLGTENVDYLRQVDALDTEALEEFISLMNSGGAVTAEERVRARFPVLGDYVFRPGRADWRFFVTRSGCERVLDIGAGWGNLAFEFAKDGHDVVAVDASLRKLQFLAARAAVEGVKSITCVNADFLDGLPVPDGSVDICILNGVLEWAGTFRQTRTPAAYQEALLRDAARALTPSGTLYVGIENRFGYEYFFGRADDHTRLRWTNLVPRWMADLRMWQKQGTGYRCYTYSGRGLRALLRRVGFQRVTFLWPNRDYKHYDTLVPLEEGPVRWLLRNAGIFAVPPVRHSARAVLSVLRHLGGPAEVGERARWLAEACFRRWPRLFLPVVPSFAVLAQK